MDIRQDFKLNSLSIEFHFCLNSSGVWIFFWNQFIQFDFNLNEFV